MKSDLLKEKIAVPDTSALLKNIQLIDELSTVYGRVVIPVTVINELDNIKDRNNDEALVRNAGQILKSIPNHGNIVTLPYSGEAADINNDSKIVAVAENAAKKYKCQVDIITLDAGFAARLSGNGTVGAVRLDEFMAANQGIGDIDSLKKINEYYADSYDDIEIALGILIPNEEELNAYLPEGDTLIISVVRNKGMPMNRRKAKIKWLIDKGADVNKRDCRKYYFPPLSHAVQNSDFEIFKFLLHDCNADPNVGSRNPHDAEKKMQKNEGNMPLMVAAWDNKIDFVKELCADERTSLNQQDANGFTALIKACYWGWLDCRDIILAAGADPKILDRDGYTAEDRYRESLEIGRKKNSGFSRKKQSGGKMATKMIDRICISINNRCNLDCDYCHFHKKGKIEDTEMDVFEILDNVKSYGAQDFKIGFAGNGESFLDWEKLKAYITYIEDCQNISTYVITNGMIRLPDEETLFLEEHHVNVGFSIDGYKELHDKYRCGSFDKAMKNVEHYKAVTGHYPTFNATVGQEALENAKRLIAFFKPYGTRVTFSRMIKKDGISLKAYRDFMEEAEKEIPVRRGGLDCTMYGGSCGAGINNFFFANGNVYLCGNCIDLPPLGKSGMTFEELEKFQYSFDRNYCYRESL